MNLQILISLLSVVLSLAQIRENVNPGYGSTTIFHVNEKRVVISNSQLLWHSLGYENDKLPILKPERFAQKPIFIKEENNP